MYAAADVAFVGGSLVPVGGHNPLEPAALELPVLTGPHIFNFEQVYAELFLEQAAERIADAGKLACLLRELLGNSILRAKMTTAAKTVIVRHRGATERLAGLVREVLESENERELALN